MARGGLALDRPIVSQTGFSAHDAAAASRRHRRRRPSSRRVRRLTLLRRQLAARPHVLPVFALVGRDFRQRRFVAGHRRVRLRLVSSLSGQNASFCGARLQAQRRDGRRFQVLKVPERDGRRQPTERRAGRSQLAFGSNQPKGGVEGRRVAAANCERRRKTQFGFVKLGELADRRQIKTDV